MFELNFTLEAIDRGDLFHQLLTFATIQNARMELERIGVDSSVGVVKLDATYTADLHNIDLRVPETGKKLRAVIDSVDPREGTGFRVGVYIHGTVSKLKSKGIDCSEFDLTIGKRRKVKLCYLFDWYDGSKPLIGLLKLDTIN